MDSNNTTRLYRESPKRQWCFTLFNYTNIEYNALKDKLKQHCKYAIVGEKMAPQGSTPYLQGYVSLKKRVRFNQVKNIIGNRAYVIPATGSPSQNFVYCSKDNRFWEHGSLPGPSRAEMRQDHGDLVQHLL